MKFFTLSALSIVWTLSACVNTPIKDLKKKRQNAALKSGLYCEWLPSQKLVAIDLELNLRMAKRCDSSKPFSISSYKPNGEKQGLVFCCSLSPEAIKKARKRKSRAKAKRQRKKEQNTTPQKTEPKTPATPEAGKTQETPNLGITEKDVSPGITPEIK